MPKYTGNCESHGLVQHEASKQVFDLKGGAFCPFCGKLLDLKTLKIWKKTKQK